MNGWFIQTLIATPAILSIALLSKNLISRALIFLGAIAAGHWLLFNAVQRMWELRVKEATADHVLDEMSPELADGANILFTAYFGWLPVTVYVLIIVWTYRRFIARS
jgi:hypothetical protein